MKVFMVILMILWGIGAYGYSSYWHGVYGYTGGGLGADPEGSSGVYGYNASTGYGVADIVTVAQEFTEILLTI
jgi:hypothetical protein